MFLKPLWVTTQAIVTTAGGIAGYLFGGIDGLIIALVAFVTADYLTGVMAAISEKRLSSAIGFKGIFRKIIIFTLVGLANVLDAVQGVQCAGTVLQRVDSSQAFDDSRLAFKAEQFLGQFLYALR